VFDYESHIQKVGTVGLMSQLAETFGVNDEMALVDKSLATVKDMSSERKSSSKRKKTFN
jgi:hypothetical protein